MAGIAPHNGAGSPGPSVVGRPGSAGRCVQFSGRVGGYSRRPTTREGGELALRHGRRAKGGEQNAFDTRGPAREAAYRLPCPPCGLWGGERRRTSGEPSGFRRARPSSPCPPGGPWRAEAEEWRAFRVFRNGAAFSAMAAVRSGRWTSGEPSGFRRARPSSPCPPCGPWRAEAAKWRAVGLPERCGLQRRGCRAVPWAERGGRRVASLPGVPKGVALSAAKSRARSGGRRKRG